MKAIVFFLSSIIFIGCNNSQEKSVNENNTEQMSNDFSFTVIKEMVDSYDSKTGIYSRKYLFKDSSVKVELSHAELDSIYHSFKKYDFMSFPKHFECADKMDGGFPAFFYTIEIANNGFTKKVNNSSFCDKKIEQIKSDNFYKLNNDIRRILENKPQIKKMRKSDMIFM
jgi:hypothetical protein